RDGHVTGVQTCALPILNPPSAAIAQSPAPNAAGWNRSDVTVSMLGTASAGSPAVASVTYTEAGAASAGPATIAGAAAQLIVSQRSEERRVGKEGRGRRA